MSYPTNFPLPTIEGYSIAVDMGVIRTEFNSGRTRQRRVFSTMPQQFSLRFVVPLADLNAWQVWVNKNAYSWFKLKIASYMNMPSEHCKEHSIRFIGDLALSPHESGKYFFVTVSAEQDFGTNANDSMLDSGISPDGIIEDGDWVIGGTPAAPNDAIGPVVNGRPGSPSKLGTLIAGSPSAPSAVV